MDWLDYLSLAEDLNRTNQQAYIRSAMSRAYYSIFNIVKENNDDFVFDDRDGRVHARLIDHLRNSRNSIDATIGTVLATLRTKRNNADYDDQDILTQRDVETHIASARYIKDY